MDNIKERFEEEFIRDDGLMDKYVEIPDLESELGFQTISTGEAILAFFKQELEALASEVEAQDLTKRNWGVQEAATLIRNRAELLK